MIQKLWNFHTVHLQHIVMVLRSQWWFSFLKNVMLLKETHVRQLKYYRHSTSYLINMFSIQTKISWKRTNDVVKVFELFSRKNNYKEKNMNSWNDLLCHEKISSLLSEFGYQHDHTGFLEFPKPLNWHWPRWPTSRAWRPPWGCHGL